MEWVWKLLLHHQIFISKFTLGYYAYSSLSHKFYVRWYFSQAMAGWELFLLFIQSTQEWKKRTVWTNSFLITPRERDDNFLNAKQNDCSSWIGERKSFVIDQSILLNQRVDDSWVARAIILHPAISFFYSFFYYTIIHIVCHFTVDCRSLPFHPSRARWHNNEGRMTTIV